MYMAYVGEVSITVSDRSLNPNTIPKSNHNHSNMYRRNTGSINRNPIFHFANGYYEYYKDKSNFTAGAVRVEANLPRISAVTTQFLM